MSHPLLLYGATGYTGRLILNGMLALGLHPILGGRDERKLAAVAEPLRLEFRVAALADTERLEAALGDVCVVLNAAGPFSGTAPRMATACLRTGTHYLDITGEASVIDALASLHAAARRQRLMVMPGVGFDVVPSDCLAAHVAKRLPSAERLAFGVRGLTLASRGSARTLVEQAGRPILVRRGGAITTLPPGARERDFDYGDGPRRSVNVTWGDVVTAYYTTGIPNIEVYFEATPLFRNALLASRIFGPMMASAPGQTWLKTCADFTAEGPTEEERAAVQTVIVAEVEDSRGRRVCARLKAPQAYSFTAMSAPAVARRVLAGDVEAGFQTPGRVYGADFVLSFAHVSREDM